MKPRWIIALLAGLWLWGSAAAVMSGAHAQESPTPSPTYDPLRLPELSANPSEAELGEYLYYYHCMPCHGDLGQGLTDEFRGVWVEDHQYCWGRGCHGGRPHDEGFPIPTVVPPVIAGDDALRRFERFEALLAYLHDTHPPQYPGKLEDDEYRAMTVYLWEANHKPEPAAAATLTPADTVRPTDTMRPIDTMRPMDTMPPAEPPAPVQGLRAGWVVAGLAAGTLAVFALLWIARRSKDDRGGG